MISELTDTLDPNLYLDCEQRVEDDICRCCGQLATTKKQRKNKNHPSLKTKFAADTALLFDIDISCDEETRHPRFICPNCAMRIVNVKKKQTVARVKAARDLANDRRGESAQTTEHATPAEEVSGSIPPVAARSILVGSVSV